QWVETNVLSIWHWADCARKFILMRAVGGKSLCLLLMALLLTACACGRQTAESTTAAAPVSADELKVRVVTVGFDQDTQAHYVLLANADGSRELPIMIGENEAQAILLMLHGIKPQRPLTHDLLQSIIEKTGNRVDRITISDLRDEVYYAQIFMNKGKYTIDSRPSDAIALAMHFNAPIYVSSKLFIGGRQPLLTRNSPGPHTAKALGITVEELSPELATYFKAPAGGGVLVADVSGSATVSGVQRGDVITKVGLHDVKAPSDFSTDVEAEGTDADVTLQLYRDGINRTVVVRAPSGA